MQSFMQVRLDPKLKMEIEMTASEWRHLRKQLRGEARPVKDEDETCGTVS